MINKIGKNLLDDLYSDSSILPVGFVVLMLLKNRQFIGNHHPGSMVVQ